MAEVKRFFDFKFFLFTVKLLFYWFKICLIGARAAGSADVDMSALRSNIINQ
jgi:hypothetical protein